MGVTVPGFFSVDRSNAPTTRTNREEDIMKKSNEIKNKASESKMDKKESEKKTSQKNANETKKVKANSSKLQKASLLEPSSATRESKGTTKPEPSPSSNENKP